jgi:hypothetical protein
MTSKLLKAAPAADETGLVLPQLLKPALRPTIG